MAAILAGENEGEIAPALRENQSRRVKGTELSVPRRDASADEDRARIRQQSPHTAQRCDAIRTDGRRIECRRVDRAWNDRDALRLDAVALDHRERDIARRRNEA